MTYDLARVGAVKRMRFEESISDSKSLPYLKDYKALVTKQYHTNSKNFFALLQHDSI